MDGASRRMGSTVAGLNGHVLRLDRAVARERRLDTCGSGVPGRRGRSFFIGAPRGPGRSPG